MVEGLAQVLYPEPWGIAADHQQRTGHALRRLAYSAQQALAKAVPVLSYGLDVVGQIERLRRSHQQAASRLTTGGQYRIEASSAQGSLFGREALRQERPAAAVARGPEGEHHQGGLRSSRNTR